MSSEVFLSLENEQKLLLGERILFVISSLLNIVALFFLVRKTPPHLAEIRIYLLYIQATVIATDVYYGVLFEPFPVLQVFAGYCVGLLCRYLQPTVVVFYYGVTISAMGASINLCTIHRHQKIVERGRLILSKSGRTAIKVVLLLSFCIAFLVFAVFPFDESESEKLIEESTPDVRWMRDRGGYFMIQRSFLPLLATSFILMLLSAAILVPAALFAHMFVALHREINKSARLKRTIRTSLIGLFVQINVPNLFISIPMIILGLEIMFDCFTFSKDKLDIKSLYFTRSLVHLTDVCLFANCMIPFHPIVHNLILLSIIPEYRTQFARLLLFDLKNSATVNTTVTRTRAMSFPM